MSDFFLQKGIIATLLLFLYLIRIPECQGEDPPAEPPAEAPPPPPPAPPPAGGGGPPGGGGGAGGESGAAGGGDGGTSTTEDPLASDFDLECYQCIADGTELVPPCDSVFFTSLDTEELKELEFQCPKELPDFCVKKEITYFNSDLKMTWRGCTGKVDEMENTLRAGCIKIYDNDTVTEMCFCETTHCNDSSRPRSNSLLTLLYFGTIVVFLLKNMYIYVL